MLPLTDDRLPDDIELPIDEFVPEFFFLDLAFPILGFIDFPLFTHLDPFIVPLLAKMCAGVMFWALSNVSNSWELVNDIGWVTEDIFGVVAVVDNDNHTVMVV